MTQHTIASPIRIGIIGAGAATEKLYLPAITHVPGSVVTHLIDLDAQRRTELAAQHHIATTSGDYRDLFGKVDAVVVATPPSSHAALSIACLEAGLDVLCEKPLTISRAEGERMSEAARRTGRHLAVGMVRRLSYSSQILRMILRANLLGELQRFDVAEGYEFRWPVRSGHLFQNSKAGGVLVDTGTHLIDLLYWATGASAIRLRSYRDDGWGGVPANAEIECEIETGWGWISGRITLSFTRSLRNTIRLEGLHGSVEAPTLPGGLDVRMLPRDTSEPPLQIRPQQVDQPRTLTDQFALQIERFVEALRGGPVRYVPAEEALPTLALIEACQTNRTLLVQSWECKHLEPFFGVAADD